VACPWVERLSEAPAFDLKKLGSHSKEKKAKVPVPSPPSTSLPSKEEAPSRQAKSKRKLDDVIPDAEPEVPKKKKSRDSVVSLSITCLSILVLFFI